jgi:hypothetical protein
MSHRDDYSRRTRARDEREDRRQQRGAAGAAVDDGAAGAALRFLIFGFWYVRRHAILPILAAFSVLGILDAP